MSHLQHKATSPAFVRCCVLTISARAPQPTTPAAAPSRTFQRRRAPGRRPRDRPRRPRRNSEDSPRAIRGIVDPGDHHDGGTGITSRDSTYEVVGSLLDKRLEGFGELFRMLSYEDIGAAAMMSRAVCRDRSRKTHPLASRIGERGPSGHEQADPSRAWAPRARALALIADFVMTTADQ